MYGTGVDNVAAQLNISHGVFLNNRAKYGGAIYARDGHPNLLFSYITFNQNLADQGGGAVYLQKGKLVDHSSIYTNNTAGMYGGALCLFNGSYSSLFDSSLVSNTAGWRYAS